MDIHSTKQLVVGVFIAESKRDNGNVHRAAANINASKSRAARGSVCNVLLSAVQPSVVGIHLIPSAFHCSRHCLGCPRSVSFAIGEV